MQSPMQRLAATHEARRGRQSRQQNKVAQRHVYPCHCTERVPAELSNGKDISGVSKNYMVPTSRFPSYCIAPALRLSPSAICIVVPNVCVPNEGEMQDSTPEIQLQLLADAIVPNGPIHPYRKTDCERHRSLAKDWKTRWRHFALL